jgi:hypothetical protein
MREYDEMPGVIFDSDSARAVKRRLVGHVDFRVAYRGFVRTKAFPHIAQNRRHVLFHAVLRLVHQLHPSLLENNECQLAAVPHCVQNGSTGSIFSMKRVGVSFFTGMAVSFRGYCICS